jgi:hypothetical protein
MQVVVDQTDAASSTTTIGATTQRTPQTLESLTAAIDADFSKQFDTNVRRRASGAAPVVCAKKKGGQAIVRSTTSG